MFCLANTFMSPREESMPVNIWRQTEREREREREIEREREREKERDPTFFYEPEGYF